MISTTKIIASYILGCCAVVTASAQDKPFTLKVKAGADVSGAILVRYSLKAGQKKDTLTAVNGVINFSGRVNDERQKAQLISYGKEGKMNGNLMFYLEPGTITLESNSTTNGYIIGGTPLNRDLEQYNHEVNKLIGAHMPGVEEGVIVMQDRRLEVVRRFVVKHPASLVGLDALDDYAAHNKKPASIDSVFTLLAKNLKSSPTGKQIADRVKGMRAATVGESAPPFSLPDTAGKWFRYPTLKVNMC